MMQYHCELILIGFQSFQSENSLHSEMNSLFQDKELV